MNNHAHIAYDPNARRDTPLALKLKDRIVREGPITIGEYMRACLHDPELGYYRSQAVIGAAGDFITAPEISQIFGELIGLWSAVVWQQMGSPQPCALTEFGPGRGTMMRDALRAASVVPNFKESLRVTMAETNPVLAEQQKAALFNSGVEVTWPSIYPAPPMPFAGSMFIGNEFLDTIEVDQHVNTPRGACWRYVGLDQNGQLTYLAREPVLDTDIQPWPFPPGPIGAIFETRHMTPMLQGLLVAADGKPFVALFIDYGHDASNLGETLQAVRGHTYEHPLTSPGEADLSAHVDFARLAAEARSNGLAVDGPVTQAEFLGALGIAERTSRLMAANPGNAGVIDMAVARLIAPNAMGTRFKAIGLRSPELPPLPGLQRF
jgi:NADH dehydrogenase [ubiquinone] 1 alpha subcomplex assembly factor 7